MFKVIFNGSTIVVDDHCAVKVDGGTLTIIRDYDEVKQLPAPSAPRGSVLMEEYAERGVVRKTNAKKPAKPSTMQSGLWQGTVPHKLASREEIADYILKVVEFGYAGNGFIARRGLTLSLRRVCAKTVSARYINAIIKEMVEVGTIVITQVPWSKMPHYSLPGNEQLIEDETKVA